MERYKEMHIQDDAKSCTIRRHKAVQSGAKRWFAMQSDAKRCKAKKKQRKSESKAMRTIQSDEMERFKEMHIQDDAKSCTIRRHKAVQSGAM
jgi:hypothetical protein